jgi:tetratricopeptide (TPR) repeat protein
MGILFVLLSLSFTNIERFFKKIIPFAAALIICALGCLSFIHTSNFKNSIALREYDALTSPNDPKLYNPLSRMAIPENLTREIKAVKDRSLVQENDSNAVSKKEIWAAIDDFKKDLISNPDNPDAHHALAVLYFTQGLFLSSEKYFIAAAKINPQNANIPYNLGILYYIAHEVNKAEKAWLEAVRLDSMMGKAHHNLSYLYYESGQYDLAWLHLQNAMECGIQVIPDFVSEVKKKLL